MTRTLQELVVAICTYRRESLEAAIQSVGTQTLLPDRLIVIDNDDTPSAQFRAQRAAASLTLDYRHVGGQNISIARNAALAAAAGARLAFIDDDEIADPNWLAALSKALRPAQSAVFGPVIAAYPEHAPAWMQSLAPHNQSVWEHNGVIKSGYTGNCLIDLAHPAMRDLRFNEALGRTHGADTDYFRQGFDNGASYCAAPDALVHEPVLHERLAWRWLLHRRYHFGHSVGRNANSKRTIAQRAGSALNASAKSAYCAFDALLHALDPIASRRAILRGALHFGRLAHALGVVPRDYYVSVPPKGDKNP